MSHSTSFAALPAGYIRFCGAMAERQIRLMTTLSRAMLQPNPFLVTLAEMQWLGALESDPGETTNGNPASSRRSGEQKARAGRTSARRHRQPSVPPAMPGTE